MEKQAEVEARQSQSAYVFLYYAACTFDLSLKRQRFRPNMSIDTANSFRLVCLSFAAVAHIYMLSWFEFFEPFKVLSVAED